jgi:hypothetical protein
MRVSSSDSPQAATDASSAEARKLTIAVTKPKKTSESAGHQDADPGLNQLNR